MRYLQTIAKLESRANLLRAAAQSTEKEVKILNIINDILRPQIYELTKLDDLKAENK
jgi:GTP-binding protein EngB required for normal cell division